MSNANELLGARIRELRKAQGIAQERLAEELGIEQQYMSRVELGKSYPSLDRLMRIAELLHVSLPRLFEFDHLEEGETKIEKIDEMLRELDETNLKVIYRIVKSFREG
jgi:transcriptional regulator with XRE-family HTH domain